MKKVFLVAAMLFAGMFTFCNAQDVRVNINNQDYSNNKDCEFKINGICSSEDIGGVDFEVTFVDNEKAVNRRDVFIVLTNYNTFPVTVLLKYEYYHPWVWFEETTSVVLGVDGTKKIKAGNDDARLVGMIVRKLAQ